jgi:alpha-beta hydrolase superfamily lysophospholipase
MTRSRARAAVAVCVVIVALACLLAVAAAVASFRASDALLVPHPVATPYGHLDPTTAYGLPFATVNVAEPLGQAPAWYVRGRTATWAVLVHGMGAPQAEALPMLPLLHSRGFAALVITYRNDPGAPRSPDGLSHLGADEWRDLDAAVGYAVEHGAARVVLVGYSMGGEIVCNFLRRSASTGRVDAVVLDSPVLEWRGPLATAAAGTSLPWPLVGAAEHVVSWRTGVDLDDQDQLRHASAFRVPMLLLQGTADPVTPVADSRALAARNRNVQLVEFPDAGHADEWQSDPVQYNLAVRSFLAGLGRAD